MKIFDTHFHLPPESENSFTGFDSAMNEHLLQAAQKLVLTDTPFEVCRLAAGGEFSDSLRAMEYARSRENAFFSCGVHPHQAAEYLQNREDFSIFRGKKSLVAVGEIGLDYFYEESPVAEQRQVFDEFLALALEWKLPAMLHIRDKEDSFDAGNDALARLTGFAGAGGRFVIHCCTIPEEKIEPFLDLGAMIGVTGMVTFKRAENVRAMLKKVPTERLLLETDSPYLAPVPFRGKENTPGLLPLAAQALAVERDMSLEELCRVTTENAERFYLTNTGA